MAGIERLSANLGDWLWDRPHGFRVQNLVPPHFEAYLRIFYPFLPEEWWQQPMGVPPQVVRWSDLATELGVKFHAEVSPQVVGPGAGRGIWNTEGYIDDWTGGTLMMALAETTGDQPVYFGYRLGAIIKLQDSFVLRAGVADLVAVRRYVDQMVPDWSRPVCGPELVWPEDRSWSVICDYDLTSAYVGCTEAVGISLRGVPELEVLPVTAESRIDRDGDTPNGRWRPEPPVAPKP